MSTISDLRTEYALAGLTESDLDPDPIRQFGRWFEAALAANVPEPNAMILATATPDGLPSARVVLLKDFDANGFAFFTNYESQKGAELGQNANAALVFFWPTLERQIRIAGPVERTSQEQSEAYFHKRPRESQLGAWASRQSEVLSSRQELDERFRQVAREFEGKAVPLPSYWGGFRLKPTKMEFWQGRPNRLHDRFRYELGAEKDWGIARISP